MYIPDTVRLSVLKQDHFAYEEFTVLDTVIMGNKRLYDIMKRRMLSTPKKISATRMASVLPN